MKVVAMRCPQCRIKTVARGTTARDAVLDRHGPKRSESYLAVRMDGELVDVASLGPDWLERLAEAEPRNDPAPAVREVLDVCRFSGGTVADARAGISAYARSVLTRRAESDDAEHAEAHVRLAASAKADISTSFIGTVEVEELDEDHEAMLAGPKVAVVRADGEHATPRPEWVGAECAWIGWECECKTTRGGKAGHYRAPLARGQRGRPVWEAPEIQSGRATEYADFRIMITKDVEVGHGAGFETVTTECPSWRPVRRSEVLNPHRGLSGTPLTGREAGGTAAGQSEADPRPTVLGAAEVDSSNGLPASVRAVWDWAARCVRSRWELAGERHTTIGLVGRVPADHPSAPGLWWAYWKDDRFESAFWCGWPVKVGELKRLLAGEPEAAVIKRIDPDVPKTRKKPTKKAAPSRRKDWVQT